MAKNGSEQDVLVEVEIRMKLFFWTVKVKTNGKMTVGRSEESNTLL